MALSRARPQAIGIHRHTPYPPDPDIHQRVSGAGVEADGGQRSVRRQQGQITDAADIDDHAVVAFGAKHGIVKGGRQRCALAAGGHVPAAQIRDRGNSGALGNDVGIAYLHRARKLGVRCVKHGLSVAADGADL